MLIDAHAHFCFPDEPASRRDVRTLYCGTNPETAARALGLRDERTLVSCGLHPWFADQYEVSDMLPYIRQCPVLGEIGLDSVWTDVDMDRQRAVFEEQLALAEGLGLPILLHTKGMEAEIARRISGLTVRKLVHWYSCMEHLDDYLAQDCYFTVGPDWERNPAVGQVLRRAPLERLLTETDGVDAVAWALGREVESREIGPVLEGELRAIAAAKGIGEIEAQARVEANFERFLYGEEGRPVRG